MLKRALLSTLLVGVAASAQAESLELDINSVTLRAIYAHKIEAGEKYQGLEVDFGYLYREDKSATDVISASLFVSGENWTEAGTFDIRLGGRSMLATPGSENVVAIGLGGRVRYSPVHRVGISAEGYFAPKILAFSDGERMRELGLRADYQVLPQAVVYAGYRHLAVDTLLRRNLTLDNAGHIGMQLLF